MTKSLNAFMHIFEGGHGNTKRRTHFLQLVCECVSKLISMVKNLFGNFKVFNNFEYNVRQSEILTICSAFKETFKEALIEYTSSAK